MSYELYYTSAPHGLRPGSGGGFCTVAATAGLPAVLAGRLESLSSYRPLFPVGSPAAGRNPAAYAHWRVPAGKTYSVLSRVAPAGLDFTQRPNHLAYHLALEPGEPPPAGPAWVQLQPGAMAAAWSRPPETLPAGKVIPQATADPRPCARWAAAAGDAGWGGILAEAFLLDPGRPAYVVYEPGLDPLPLLDEALALLPPRARWQVTYSTYFTALPAGLACAWRCVPAGTPAAADAARHAAKGVVIDLTRTPGPAPDRDSARAARAGEAVVLPPDGASPLGPLVAGMRHG